MAELTREQLLAKEDLGVEKVVFEDSDDFVYVRMMNGRERDRFEQSMLREKKDKKGRISYDRALEDYRAKLAVNTVCNENGENTFEPEDYELLSTNMSAFRLEQIVNVAQRLNKITQEDKDELIKNSEGDQSEGDTSDSSVA